MRGLVYILTLCILMGFPTQIASLRMGLSIIYFKRFPNKYRLQSLNIVFIIANSADPDEMQQYVAFHLGLHCLPNYPFNGFQNRKG